MPQSDPQSFLVVECQKTPNLNNKYVLIPDTWVKTSGGFNKRKVAITYPPGEECRVLDMIKLGEPANSKWRFYIGVKRYESDNFDHAFRYLQLLRTGNRPVVKKHQKVKNTKREQPVSGEGGSLKIRILLPKSATDTKRRSLKPRFISKKLTEQRDSTPEVKPPKGEIVRRRSKFTELFGTDSESSTPSPTPSTGNPNVDNGENNSMSEDEDSQTEPTYEATVASADAMLAHLKNGLNSGLTVCDKLILDKVVSEQKQLAANIKNVALILRQLYMKHIDNDNILKGLYLKCNSRGETKQQLQGGDDKMAVDDRSDDSQEGNEIAEDDEDETDNSQHSDDSEAEDKKFKMEEMDQKLTLRHPEPRKGLLELKKKSGVYICARGFAKCNVKANNVNKLAWLLFQEVFKPEALASCTLMGKDRSNDERKPLHAGARSAITSYAILYGKKVGWEPVSLTALQKSLRNMMYSYRTRYDSGSCPQLQ